jgi:hypothetical protein
VYERGGEAAVDPLESVLPEARVPSPFYTEEQRITDRSFNRITPVERTQATRS